MSTMTGVSLSRTLMFEEMLKHAEKITQPHYVGAIKIAVGLTRKTAQAVLNNQMTSFDANPADHGCQMRTDFLLRFGSSESLKDEARKLLERMNELSPQAHKQTSLDLLEQVHVSEEMAFLIQSHLLTMTRVPGKTHAFGFPYTETNPGRLTTYSKRLLPYSLLDQFTRLNAANVAAVSIEYLRKAAQTNGGPDLELHKRALSERNIRYIDRKPFALIPIQVKVFLETLNSLGATVAFQHLKDPSSRIYFRASASGFEEVKQDAVEDRTLLSVFEVGIKPDCSMVDVQAAVEKEGLKEIVLHLASKHAPYDRKSSTLDDVKDVESRKLIESYRALDLSLPFEIFHVKCDAHKRR